MILTEELTVDGKILVRTWSDANKLIERDGVKYTEAIDQQESEREYTETDETIPSEAISDSEALKIILGE